MGDIQIYAEINLGGDPETAAEIAERVREAMKEYTETQERHAVQAAVMWEAWCERMKAEGLMAQEDEE